MEVNELRGNREIEFVQGDTYEYALKFGGADIAAMVQRVVFTCGFFGIEREFNVREDENGVKTWFVRFSREETMAMQPAITTYDVTTWFSDGVSESVVSETGVRFIVKKKQNPVKAVDGDGGM